jgi:hypothetical protein
MQVMMDEIWRYSRYYGDMLFTAFRLHAEKEDYAAILVLFNVMELICKSVRENYNQNFLEDLSDLKNRNILSEENYEFLANKESGIRGIRNIMTHRDAYQYYFENSEGKALPFAEMGTWGIVFDSFAPRIIQILHEIIDNSNWKNENNKE